MNTKLINQVQIKNFEKEYKKSKEEYEINIESEYRDTEKDLRKQLNKGLENLLSEIGKCIENGPVYMEDQYVVYDNEIVALLPNLDYYEGVILTNNTCSMVGIDENILNFSTYKGDFMTLNECRRSSKKQLIKKRYIKQAYVKTDRLMGGLDINTNQTQNDPGLVNPIYRLGKIDELRIVDYKVVLYLWIKNNLMPKDISKENKKIMVMLSELYKKGYLTKDLDVEWDKFKQDCIEEIRSLTKPKSLVNVIIDKLLNCEKIRAAIDSYDIKMLTDLNRGHWDLWESTEGNRSGTKLERELVARDPRADIKEGGIVGIDFGTKSTVVVHQEDREFTLPMRVGTGDFSKKTEQSQYENPSVIELRNLKSFMDSYKERDGRPNTLWNDLTVSHTAFNNLVNSSSEEYYAFINDLKQWADDRKRKMLLRDKSGMSIALNTFLDLEADDLNPIELYAYYLGLYINNMHNGIYMDYSLSFPVTYEKDVRKKILESFKNGIKKSLPIAVLNDEEVMKKFRVYMGASEPAAYAICALEEYGFEPEGDEKIFYGIFDMGGGTSDFDFGIWKESDKPRKYDFAIEHFGAGGDRYLGGENLLELLAFHIFKNNEDVLRENKIAFVLPAECNKFLGSETLLNESQEAKLNMKQLMEKMRPLWEKYDDYEKQFDKGVIQVDLTDNMGKLLPNVELKLEIKGLENIIKERIEKGVKNFFESFKISFENLKDIKVDKLHIFLAGNSCKSAFVNELFEEYIQKETNDDNNIVFELYPPLGTKEAYQKQKELGISREEDDRSRPTGKTGVAFGLIESRKGGKIEVIDGNVGIDEEIKFKYFIGMNRRKKFKVLIDRDLPYFEWVEFADSQEEDFEIYYTELSEALTSSMDIQMVERKKCRLDKAYDEGIVYLRRVTPTVIQYVVATVEGIDKEEYLSEMINVDLS